MKIILSRKGVDSAAGRCASPLIGDQPVSLPIPTREPSPTTYGDLHHLLRTLARDCSWGRLIDDGLCHLDPDIDRKALATRTSGWKGSLGQVSSSLSHLRNQGVGAGDIFLFWGLYRLVEQVDGAWRYCGPRQHALFGWLHVETVCDIAEDGVDVLQRYPWLHDHPHVREGWKGPNAVYVASESFEIAGRGFPGSGVFRRAYRLTDIGSRLPSVWTVPDWLDPTAGGVGMTYHPPERWLGDGRLKAAARGQEFVADIAERDDAERWIAEILEAHI